MKIERITLNLVKGTLLSMLVFFTISFFSVIYSIHHPEFNGQLRIGFPFEYYHQFWLNGNKYPNGGGNFLNLILDCTICWVIVAGTFFLVKQPHKKRPIN